MKRSVLVIGAHHGLGAIVLSLAKQRGFESIAFQSDVLDADAVSDAVAGCAAVVSTLGPRRDSVPDLCSRGTRNIIAGMKAHSVTRLVQVTGAVIGHPRSKLGCVYRTIEAFVPSEQLRDRREQETLVRQSGLEWTVVRPTRLTDEAGRGIWREGEEQVIGAFARIARADVAKCIVDALDDARTIHRATTLLY